MSKYDYVVSYYKEKRWWFKQSSTDALDKVIAVSVDFRAKAITIPK